ncbi:type II restriction endonuclease [uncultured Sunxiuqinia sp.]|uniref:type II restriction endonuclease n=1 Tax=uncultured Sunxiuqinia sp. TaxID=1573825 RepID=UPI002AA81129|nr:type II restriction endonuclease [uncultured Sunxiuqinia sp.]
MSSEVLRSAIKSCNESELAFSKFITANDAGTTGAHQSGFHIHKHAWSLFFDSEGVKGKNKDIFVKIKWQDDFETDSRFIHYGVGTRNEYRLTRFGKGFPFLSDDNVGDLLVLAKKDEKYYHGFVLKTDNDIEEFFNAFGISSTETNGLIPKTSTNTDEQRLLILFHEFITNLKVDFPPTVELAIGARNIFLKAFKHSRMDILKKPDNEMLSWLATEFELFKAIENDRYGEIIRTPFPTVNDLIVAANTILNRRKSRAGKSLEHHLSEVFDAWSISYSSQPRTEQNKKPDFIFPNIETYYREPAGSKNLIFLGAKTTCKDRWRQIVNEADKIPQKHLFTLQQGISANQLKEMRTHGVTLVVPSPYLKNFPKELRHEIWTLGKFLEFAKEKSQ